MLQQNENAESKNVIYIPRAYQPFVNKLTAELSNQEISELYNAADFLELPFITNAIGAVIADHIYIFVQEKR